MKVRRAGLSLLTAAIASPVHAQSLGLSEDHSASPLRVIGALVLCLLVAGGLAFALRNRLGAAQPRTREGRRLRLLESFRLSHQTDICLVANGEEQILLAVAASGVKVLSRGPAAGLDEEKT